MRGFICALTDASTLLTLLHDQVAKNNYSFVVMTSATKVVRKLSAGGSPEELLKLSKALKKLDKLF